MSARLSARPIIAVAALGIAAVGSLCRPVAAEEHWPGSYLIWPREIVGHPNPCPTCFYLQVYLSTGVQPYEPGKLFMVNFDGGYFFKTCRSLAAFVNNGVLQDDVIPISPRHVMVALRELPYTAGVAHDEVYGDGYIFMASSEHPVMPFKSYIPRGFIRKSSNQWQYRRPFGRLSETKPSMPRDAASRAFLSRVDCK